MSPAWYMGWNFVAANGERSFSLFMVARWACIPFSWLGGVICYLWARDLYGRPAGAIACAIWCFEPNILAHASLMTPDAHATSLGLAACYTFWRWLKRPTWTQTLVTGVVLGLAELAKTTFVLFYPLWPLLWLVYRWADRKQMQLADWMREAAMLAARMAIGLYVLNLGYGFEGSLKPLGEYQFVSKLFAGEEGEKAATSGNTPPPLDGRGAGTKSTDNPPHTDHSTPPFAHNRFASTWIAAIPVPFPANYIIGIDLQQHDFEDYGRPSYLRGEWRDRGWWYYYLYAAAIKVPLGLLALGAASMLMLLSGRSTVAWRDTFILLSPPLILFTVVSSKTGFSEHFRYALPCFPFIFVWLSGLVSNLLDIADRKVVNYPRHQRYAVRMLAAFSSLTLLLWSGASSLWIYPHSLSYFNESIGGPLNGPRHLLGSNVDWGQDLRYAIWWRESRHKNLFPSVRFVYCGQVPPPSAEGFGGMHWGHVAAQKLPVVHRGKASWFVISVNAMNSPNSVRSMVLGNQSALSPLAMDEIRRLPVFDRAGWSFVIVRNPNR